MSKSTLAELRSLISSGHTGRAIAVLKQLNLKEVRRPDYAELAMIARRAGLPRLALRLLNPVVRSDGTPSPRLDRASGAERAEYAASLVRIGIISEAVKILESLDPDTHPESVFYRVLALFRHWRYREAIPLLERYLRYPLQQRQRLIAQVNLAAALVFVGEHDRATELLRETIVRAGEMRAADLPGFSHEILAQALIQARRFVDARAELALAGEYLAGGKVLNQLFVAKWTAICDLREAPENPAARARLAETRSEALRLGEWEIVRDLDHHSAVATGSYPQFLHVYFGTPFPAYRERILAEFRPGSAVPREYVWRVPPSDEENVGRLPMLDDLPLETGTLPEALLRALASDFYRPFHTPSLFALVYPDEYYNPLTSPNRVQALVLRLRERLAAAGSPIRVLQEAGAYRLSSRQACGIRVVSEVAIVEPAQDALRRLRKAFAGQWFSSKMAAGVLGISQRSALRLLSLSGDETGLMREGTFARARYRFEFAAVAAA